MTFPTRALHRALTVGIRREDATRIWERRAPLTPDAVYSLIAEKDVNVHVEHCDRRAFSDTEYIKAGASVHPNLDAANVILGIKEPPLDRLNLSPTPSAGLTTRARTHMMFSHTAKGQSYNTPLLSMFLSGQHPGRDQHQDLPTLIDFEYLTDDKGKRTVGFGWFAGVAGVLESLSSMAHAHLELGVASPFLYTPRPHTMHSLKDIRARLRSIGDTIASEGTPAKLGPFIIGLTGQGNVSNGCLSMLSELPLQSISVKDLHGLVTNNDTDRTKIYLLHATPADYLRRPDGTSYSRSDYYTSPHLYESTFAEEIAPYLTLFLNGTGWSPSFPRLMTNEQLEVALSRAQTLGGARFTNIGDISCDPEGGLEFLSHSTTLSVPFEKYRPANLPAHLPSVQIMAVDILPTSLPLDASGHFSDSLRPYLNSVIDSYHGKPGEEAEAIRRATIVRQGKLEDKHAWLQEKVDGWRQTTPGHSGRAQGVLKKKNVLLLGSGMVAGPAVQRIAARKDVQLLVASNSVSEMEKLSAPYDNVDHKVIDVGNREALTALVAEADVVVSLLPAAFHVLAAELCIEHKKHLVTASYISNEMQALSAQAISQDVLLLNEIGLDPGIDHCSAISLVSKLQAEQKKIVSFVSFCGGLPSPDISAANMGPLGYKFSWSPRGVLTAALNSARYLLRNKHVEVSGPDLLQSYFPEVPITKDFALEGLPNRNSMPYSDMYSLKGENGGNNSLRTVLRGTLRYPGFSDLMHGFRSLGLLELNGTIKDLRRWQDLVPRAIKLRQELHPEQTALLSDSTDRATSAMVSLLSVPLPSLPPSDKPITPLDAFANLLAHKLQYMQGEKDMVILAHEIIAKPLSGPEEVHTSSLIAFGTEEHSAMALTVGLPVALAALEVLDGKVNVRGVVGPGDATIREPVLTGLEAAGLGMVDTMKSNETSIEASLFSRQ